MLSYDSKLPMSVTSTWMHHHIKKNDERYLCGVKHDNRGFFFHSINERLELSKTGGNGVMCTKCLKAFDKIMLLQENPSIKAK